MVVPVAPNIETAAPGRRYTVALVAALAFWVALVAGLSYLLYARTYWLREADEANLREWFDEARIHRKSLPELVAEYLDMLDRFPPAEAESWTVRKRQEIAEQLQRLADPTRIYQGQLPLFPDIYHLELTFPGTNWKPIAWDSPVPKPRPELKATNNLSYQLLGDQEPRAVLQCEYHLHAFNTQQRETEKAHRRLLWVFGIALATGLPAVAWAYLSVHRERTRELARMRAQQQAEHAMNEALMQENRAASAERSALELKSQLFAGIGIMAGSYAHNIKNLLVRPNDLLNRCIDSDGLSTQQQTMLGEVRETLGTVTERLQQILQTVRRDPSRTSSIRVDLNGLLRNLIETWVDLAREKWKIELIADLQPGEVIVDADPSHLLQAFENLLFNARDATFEMRNSLREKAHSSQLTDNVRRSALLSAAAWKGTVTIRTRFRAETIVVEFTDNGIGMTEDVRRHCTETHFSTKRDNALFEGYSAGMGLGLSFVTVVLEHHHAKLEVESAPFEGATFRLIFPAMIPATLAGT
jgi:two-component system, cell cycle sensor histidine kinase and response regulator CckA